jgi:hypothetical protein
MTKTERLYFVWLHTCSNQEESSVPEEEEEEVLTKNVQPVLPRSRIEHEQRARFLSSIFLHSIRLLEDTRIDDVSRTLIIVDYAIRKTGDDFHIRETYRKSQLVYDASVHSTSDIDWLIRWQESLHKLPWKELSSDYHDWSDVLLKEVVAELKIISFHPSFLIVGERNLLDRRVIKTNGNGIENLLTPLWDHDDGGYAAIIPQDSTMGMKVPNFFHMIAYDRSDFKDSLMARALTDKLGNSVRNIVCHIYGMRGFRIEHLPMKVIRKPPVYPVTA